MATPDFTKMVPGFDFLQGLMKGAGSAMPSMSQWIAPTLDAEEVDKRIQELRTVQFWLEQNAKMLGATIQALEVQRMSLATLQALNVPMNDLRDALKLRPQLAAAPQPKPAAPKAEAPAPAPAPRPARQKAEADAAPAAAPGMVDPLQWWGALTRQFTELAANAVKDTPAQGLTQMAGAALKQAVQPMADAAGAVANAVKAPVARKSATAPKHAAKTAAKTARARR